MLSFASRVAGNCVRESKLVSKLLHSREILKSADLISENYTGVMQALKSNGIKGFKAVSLPSGDKIVHIPNFNRTGVVGLFPGGVMVPNGGVVDNIAIKFNAAGDCLQLTGVQKAIKGTTAGSTIRTPLGINALEQAGVKNPSEYLQVYSMKNSKGLNHKYINKTFSPFEPTQEVATSQTLAKSVQDEVQTSSINTEFETVIAQIRQKDPVVADSIKHNIDNLLQNKRTGQEKAQAYMAEIVKDYGKSDAELSAKVLEQRKIVDAKNLAKLEREREDKIYNFLCEVDSINPNIAAKLKQKIGKLYEVNPERANQFMERLMERCKDGRTNLYSYRYTQSKDSFGETILNPFSHSGDSHFRSDDILGGTGIGELGWNI